MRCAHGFEPAAVKCPEGCHGEAKTGLTQREQRLGGHSVLARQVSNQAIVDALRRAGSAKAAAKTLGINVGTIKNRAAKCVAIRQALDARPEGFRRMGVTGETARARSGNPPSRPAGSVLATSGQSGSSESENPTQGILEPRRQA